jgi:hypothetical protein
VPLAAVPSLPPGAAGAAEAQASGNFGGNATSFAACSFDNVYERRISAYASWNASFRYGIGASAGRTEIYLGVQDLFDARPAVVYWTFFPSDPGYDFVGRSFYARHSHRM